jgi:predicted nucleic acid-binding protein
MNGKPFFDTNLLIYAVASDDPRADIARKLLFQGGIISVQVLNEFVAAARRKFRMSWNEIHELLADFRVLCPDPVPLTGKTHESAVAIAVRYRYSIYDAMIVAAALEASCKTIYSEDMQHGQRIENLTICSPFRGLRTPEKA